MSNEAKVGIFVIIALIIFVATFISVANVQVAGEKVLYKTYFRFAGGLEAGNTVRFGGLKSGVVTVVQVWEDNPTRIEVLMEVGGDVPVNEKSVAKISSLSALGQNYLEITPGEMEAPRIKPEGTIPSAETPTIGDVTETITDIADNAKLFMRDVRRDFRRITDDAQKLLVNLEKLTNEDNQKRIEDLLDNTNSLVADLKPRIVDVTDQLNATMRNVDQLSEDFRVVAKTADTTILNVNRTIDETREPLKRDLEELELTLQKARELLEDVRVLVATNEDNINESVENFRNASENIEQLTDELRQRPWSLIRVKPKPDRQVPLPRASGGN